MDFYEKNADKLKEKTHSEFPEQTDQIDDCPIEQVRLTVPITDEAEVMDIHGHIHANMAMHDEEKRPKGGSTRLQFFLIVFITSFAYYIIPNFFFPSISALSFICWIWPNSITMQQIGSGTYGLGIGSFGLDWSTVAGFLGSPLATPGFAIINIFLGFCLVMYVLVPKSYWTNTYEAKRFPIYSPLVYMANGSQHDVNAVLDQKTFKFSQAGYDQLGQINLGILFVFAYGLSFVTLAASLSHVSLFHGREIWSQTKEALRLSIFTCEGFGQQLQLPYWGVLLAAALATLYASDWYYHCHNESGLNVITELIIGYMYSGRPLANVSYKTYGYISMAQAIAFLADFKLGLLSPVPIWALSCMFPSKKWIKLINMPIILGASGNMPPARSVNYIMWFVMGMLFNIVVYRRFKGWWARHNYVLSAALDAGVAFMAILTYFALGIKDINGIEWWGLDLDKQCPLANCPTAPGIKVDNCPLYD
ncbi:uncharacterized protein A4U43_C05F21930 [Asparagus officinalis]|uniref:Oligopeptide transporter n=1 Tax=Asparagus officinalis TaxID=4686 RepID=A0A5P1EXK6_ASPOF|nr:uncharacterized protein A4U43_C05F21930 [Asparagus officinalis]